MKKKICAVIALLSFFWILGTSGSFECEKIGISELVAQGAPAAVALFISCKIGGFIK